MPHGGETVKANFASDCYRAEFVGRAVRRAKRTTREKSKSWNHSRLAVATSGIPQPVMPGHRPKLAVRRWRCWFLWKTR